MVVSTQCLPCLCARPHFTRSGTCNSHIGMGVRYNAEKKKIGSYYSTPIYSFRCKCHLCSGWFEIQTDPKVRCSPFNCFSHMLDFSNSKRGTLSLLARARKTKIGTRKPMAVSQSMVLPSVQSFDDLLTFVCRYRGQSGSLGPLSSTGEDN